MVHFKAASSKKPKQKLKKIKKKNYFGMKLSSPKPKKVLKLFPKNLFSCFKMEQSQAPLKRKNLP